MRNWKKTLIKKNSSIRSAIKSLSDSGFQIALVVSNDLKLIGAITDGDIRKGLLNGLSTNHSINKIVNRNCITASPSTSEHMMKKIMQKNTILQLPLVDKNQKVIGLKVWDELLFDKQEKQIKNKIMIMAGGKGKRMLPYTRKCPKPLLRLANKPILEHILIRAKSEGFDNFVFSINYLGHMIKNFFENGKNWGVHIKYIEEKFPLGTAGSLSLLNPKPRLPFIVCNGDIISEIRFKKLLNFHIENKAIATMVVKPHELRNPYGVVKTKGNGIVDLKEKPISRSYINAGVYIFDPIVLKYLKKNKALDMNMLFQSLIRKSKKVIAYTAYESWSDVGKPTDLKKINKMK